MLVQSKCLRSGCPGSVHLFLFICFFILIALGFHCYAWVFSRCREPGLSLVAVCGLLIVVASLAVEYGL